MHEYLNPKIVPTEMQPKIKPLPPDINTSTPRNRTSTTLDISKQPNYLLGGKQGLSPRVLMFRHNSMSLAGGEAGAVDGRSELKRSVTFDANQSLTEISFSTEEKPCALVNQSMTSTTSQFHRLITKKYLNGLIQYWNHRSRKSSAEKQALKEKIKMKLATRKQKHSVEQRKGEKYTVGATKIKQKEDAHSSESNIQLQEKTENKEEIKIIKKSKSITDRVQSKGEIVPENEAISQKMKKPRHTSKKVHNTIALQRPDEAKRTWKLTSPNGLLVVLVLAT